MKDELFKDFGDAGLPDSDDQNINNTSGARQATGERTSPFPPAIEYRQPASNLPVQVSQREILRQNQSRGDDNIWTGDGDEV